MRGELTLTSRGHPGNWVLPLPCWGRNVFSHCISVGTRVVARAEVCSIFLGCCGESAVGPSFSGASWDCPDRC